MVAQLTIPPKTLTRIALTSGSAVMMRKASLTWAGQDDHVSTTSVVHLVLLDVASDIQEVSRLAPVQLGSRGSDKTRRLAGGLCSESG